MKTLARLVPSAILFAACAATVLDPSAKPAVTTDAGLPERDGGGLEPDGGGAGLDGGGAGPDAGASRSMLLTAQGGQFKGPDGKAVEVRGAISCCGGGYGWPLFDEAWADLVAGKGGNFLHARLGPFRTEGNGETDWAAVGGGYVETGGKADLSQFNEVFWARVRALLEYARGKGLWVEVDVIDGWAIKHCQAGDIPGYSAWDRNFNLLQQDVCYFAGQGELPAGSVYELWVRKVVAETGRFDNVIYQDGNEVSLIGGYHPDWTRSIAQLIRDEETKRGYPRHLFATNAGTAVAMQLPEVDYLEFHQQQPLAATACFGKPCLVNEYNPNPPLTSGEFEARYCAAKKAGTGFWYWRHTQSAAQLSASLAAFGKTCPGNTGPDGGVATGCTFPQGVPDPGFTATATAYSDTDPLVDAEVNLVMSNLTGCPVGSSCSLAAYPGASAEVKCQSWFAAVTQALRARGTCAGQHEVGSTDEIAVSNTGCPGKWYGYHVCNYGGPQVVWNPGARRGWWTIAAGYCP